MEKRMFILIGAIVMGIGAIFIIITLLIPDDIIISDIELFFGQSSVPIMVIGLILIFVGAPSLKIRGILLILVGLVFVALTIYTIILAQQPGYGLAYAYLPMFIIVSLVFIIPGIYLVRKQPQVEGKTN